ARPAAGDVELVGADQLDRDAAPEFLVFRLVYDAHAARAEAGQQAETAQAVRDLAEVAGHAARARGAAARRRAAQRRQQRVALDPGDGAPETGRESGMCVAGAGEGGGDVLVLEALEDQLLDERVGIRPRRALSPGGRHRA